MTWKQSVKLCYAHRTPQPGAYASALQDTVCCLPSTTNTPYPANRLTSRDAPCCLLLNLSSGAVSQPSSLTTRSCCSCCSRGCQVAHRRGVLVVAAMVVVAVMCVALGPAQRTHPVLEQQPPHNPAGAQLGSVSTQTMQTADTAGRHGESCGSGTHAYTHKHVLPASSTKL